ncbi:protein translocase subunit SecD [Marinicrinis sediminis]|uniref:Protein translocase subunit SecD n=1 Tax=Marinicrinis sediminis TaxID=1652465 RepID=A0ABW5R783_9BACL
MVDFKRLGAFFLIIVITAATIVWTSPEIVRNIKLGLDLKGGFEILYEVSPLEEDQEITTDTLRETAFSLEKRANVTKVSEPEIIPEGTDRIRVRLAGVEDQEQVRSIMKKPAELTFRSSDGCEDPLDYCKVELKGSDFKEGGASQDYDPNTNAPIVSIELKDADKFYEVTERLSSADLMSEGRNTLAIYLDEERLSAPSVNYPISGGNAIISGSYSINEAKELAGIINAGSLPVNLTEIYTQSVGASLGQLSLDKTVKAGLMASVLILLFMIVFYRFPGMIASVTLITYTWLLLLVFYWMKATLTLPGIAAFVLGIGMAVDANIITYERIKEEIRSGKTILSSLRAGSRNSFRTIFDANSTTIIAGVVLYYLGTGAIQGFALTLIFSILVSIVTNVFFSRLLLYLVIRSKWISKPSWFGVKEAEISEL